MAEPGHVGPAGPRPRTNWFGVVLALIFLTVGVLTLAGSSLTSAGWTNPIWVALSWHWIVAGVIAGLGLLLLASAGRRSHRG